MPASVKNILIGIFVLSAIGIIAFMLLFLHPSVGDNGKTLHVRFTDIDKVTIGTRVTFAGHPVGQVVEIKEIPEVRTDRKTEHGEIYAYELTLKIDSGVDVFNTDRILLRTSGLLGERNIEISPEPLKSGEQLKKVEKEVLYAEQVTSVEDTMHELAQLSQKFGTTLDTLHEIMVDVQKHQIVKKVSRSVDNILDITTSLNQPKKYEEILDNAVHFSDNAIAFTDKANDIITHVKEGKGTIGHLFMRDEIYLRLKSILHKGELITNDMNTYGLLYHLDKRWQRLQAKRQRLLERLSSPDEFTRYFNDEIDQISASLSEVSMVLNESECYPENRMADPNFTARYADLLKKVEGMEETLKLYNESLMEQ